MLDVAVPLGAYLGDAAVEHREAVEDFDFGIVGLVADTADIDADDVAVAVVALLVGHIPYMEVAFGVLVELGVETVAVDVAAPPRGNAGAAGVIDVMLGEDAAAGTLEGFCGGGGELAAESPVVGDFFLFVPVPVDGFEGGAEPEEAVFGGGHTVDEFLVVLYGFGVEVDVEPGDEDGTEVVPGLFVVAGGSLPGAVEEVADAFGGGLQYFHCVGACKG